MKDEDFVSYEQATKLYNLDFDWDCEMAYCIHSWMKEPRLVHFSIAHKEQCNYDGTDVYPAPSLSQVQKWLREVKGIEVIVEPRFSNYKRIGYDWMVYDDFSGDYSLRAPLPFSPSHEIALSAGIAAALELIEKKGESK